MPAARAAPAAGQPPMSYGELPCRPELAPWIAAHWLFSVRPGVGEIEHRVPLTGALFSHSQRGRPTILEGPRSEPLVTEVRGGDLVWGTHLWPGVAGALLDGPVGETVLDGGAVPLAVAVAHLAPDGLDPSLEARATDAAEAGDPEALAAALDESWAPLVARAAPLDPVVMDAVFRILRSGGTEPAAEVARRVGLSPRQLRRRFRPQVGLTVKELARIQRVRAAVVGLVAGDGTREARWVDLAVEHGYADQAHLVREVRRLTGTTPTRWARHLGRIEHGTLLR